MSDARCVPLCGAAAAYGKRVQWWQHEALCPARVKPTLSLEDVEAVVQHIKDNYPASPWLPAEPKEG